MLSACAAETAEEEAEAIAHHNAQTLNATWTDIQTSAKTARTTTAANRTNTTKTTAAAKAASGAAQLVADAANPRI